ncbi:MAG: hypothetical protein PHR16_16705 [Methylovulum sp.]|nr:hypothetical protein [Methylovulum sp.]
MARQTYSGPLPTVGDTRAQGITALSVTCESPNCRWSSYSAFDALRLPDDMVFVEIPRHRRFVCSRCGGRRVGVMPDWRQHRARGDGRAAGA